MVVQKSNSKIKNYLDFVIPNEAKRSRGISHHRHLKKLNGMRSLHTRWSVGMTIGSLALLTATFHLSIAHAATASNDNFQLDIEQFDAPVEEQIPTPTPTTKPEPQGSPGIAFIPSEFTFSLSEPLIDFGILSATNPITRTTTLNVLSPGSGYQVFTFSNHVLLSNKNSAIPDTTCDNGSCSELTASLWENNLTYGFGFRCDSLSPNLCPDDFKNENTFRQFSDRGKNERPLPVLQSNLPTKNHEARITYKVNTSGTQAKEAYENTVTYIAVPNF
jgi:hypothetical protein